MIQNDPIAIAVLHERQLANISGPKTAIFRASAILRHSHTEHNRVRVPRC